MIEYSDAMVMFKQHAKKANVMVGRGSIIFCNLTPKQKKSMRLKPIKGDNRESVDTNKNCSGSSAFLFTSDKQLKTRTTMTIYLYVPPRFINTVKAIKAAFKTNISSKTK